VCVCGCGCVCHLRAVLCAPSVCGLMELSVVLEWSGVAGWLE